MFSLEAPDMVKNGAGFKEIGKQIYVNRMQDKVTQVTVLKAGYLRPNDQENVVLC